VSPGEHHVQAAPFWLRADQAPKPSTAIVTVAADGKVEDVVRMEARAAIDGAACGGAHRLYALVSALAARRRALGASGQGPSALTGAWAEAQDRIEEHVALARAYQQPDGGFSVHFFERPGTSADVFARLGATGHIFEFLVAALDDADSNVRGAVAWALGRWLAAEGACVGRAAAALEARLRLETDADVRREIEGALHGSTRRPGNPSGEQ
jgi:hypothetical protein